MEPHPQLVSLLLQAYAPCPAFSQACQSMTWDPARGHVPRGFCGATGQLEEVELVLVCAEPGDPQDDESHAPDGSAFEHLRSAYVYAYDCFKNGKDLFHKNIRRILDSCFPGLSFDYQLRRVWITESVLCSASQEGGPVPVRVGRECRARYLDGQLALFPRATVVALGKKAADRLAGTPGLIQVDAAAPPRGGTNAARESWKIIAERVQAARAT